MKINELVKRWLIFIVYLSFHFPNFLHDLSSKILIDFFEKGFSLFCEKFRMKNPVFNTLIFMHKIWKINLHQNFDYDLRKFNFFQILFHYSFSIFVFLYFLRVFNEMPVFFSPSLHAINQDDECFIFLLKTWKDVKERMK